MAGFEQGVLRELRDRKEVAIRTPKHPGTGVTIWIVVSGDEVFIRSVKGPQGRWFRDLTGGGPATLEFAGRTVAVTAVPATDTASVERASREYLSKYRESPYAQPMVRPEVLGTTMRLEPRAA